MRGLLSLWRNCAGVAATEFALVVPALILLFFGVVEVSRFLIISQKVEKLAFAASDVVAQSSTVTTAELTAMLNATAQIMKPYTFGANGVVIVSSVYRAGGSLNAQVAWQRQGGGTLVKTSAIGAEGAAPTLPAGFTLAERDNIIIAEVFYDFTPWFTGQLVQPVTIYKKALFKPRLGALNEAPS